MPHPASRSVAALLAALVLTASQVAAQSGTPDPADADADDLTQRLESALGALSEPGSDAMLAQRLAACLRPLPATAPEHPEIVMAIRIDADGNPDQPVFIDPPAREAGVPHLRQLFRAEAALYDCAPLDIEPGQLTLRVTASALLPTFPPENPAAAAATSQAAEDTLELGRADRREIQVRLRLAGHDPGGADGVFGPNTRDSITDWQIANGHPATGFLDQTQLDALRTETAEAYAELPPPSAAPALQGRARYFRDRDGCLRYASGRIVPGQSFVCDVKGIVREF